MAHRDAAQVQFDAITTKRARSGNFSVAVIIAPQCAGDQAGRAVADRLAVDPDYRGNELRRRGDEGLARRIGLLHGEWTFLELEAVLGDDFEHHGPGDPAQDTKIGLPGDHGAIAGYDPGIGRGALGDEALPVDEPGFLGA